MPLEKESKSLKEYGICSQGSLLVLLVTEEPQADRRRLWSRLVPMDDYTEGEVAAVYSKSHKMWCLGTLTEVHAKGVFVHYKRPDGFVSKFVPWRYGDYVRVSLSSMRERRVAKDGQAYTYGEFISYYGGVSCGCQDCGVYCCGDHHWHSSCTEPSSSSAVPVDTSAVLLMNEEERKLEQRYEEEEQLQRDRAVMALEDAYWAQQDADLAQEDAYRAQEDAYWAQEYACWAQEDACWTLKVWQRRPKPARGSKSCRKAARARASYVDALFHLRLTVRKWRCS